MVPAIYSQHSVIEQFRQAMAAAGVAYSGEIHADTEKIQRFTVDGDRNKSMTGWYLFYTDGVPAGEFGCWKRGVQSTWCSVSENKLTPQELDALQAKRRLNEERRKAEAEARYSAAEAEANVIWNSAIPCDSHPYLTRKGVVSHGLKLARWIRKTEEGRVWLDVKDALIVPIKIGKRIVSLQAIFPDKDNTSGRDKDFLPGGRKAGGFFVVGPAPAKDDYSPTFVVCEGYSTGATIHAATGYTVLVAFDAGNIERVASKLRERYPLARIIIAADNDRWTETPVPNPGVTFADRAAQACGGELVVPDFDDLERRPTDFNDLAAQEGIAAVRAAFFPEESTADDEDSADLSLDAANDNDEEDARCLGKLTDWILSNASIRIVGRDQEDGIWLVKPGCDVPVHYKASKLMRKAELINLMPKKTLEDLVLLSGQGERFTAESAASALMQAGAENPVYSAAECDGRRQHDDGDLTGIQGQDSATLAKKLQDLTLFDVPSQAWYRWDTVWRRINEELVRKVLVAEVDRCLGSEFDNSYINGTVALLKTRLARVNEVGSSLGDEIWEGDRNLLPMRNGILDLESRKLINHSPQFMFNWVIPHDYNNDAECPVTQNFLHQLSGGDVSTEAVLYAFLAAVLHGRYDLERYLEFVGMAGTGKSTYISLCKELVGEDNVHSTDMRTLHNNQFETANIYGKRLVMISDADKYGGDVGVFKSMTGRDVVRREEKRKQAQSGFVYKGMVIVAANNPVQFADTSTAMARRRIPVHIDKKLDKTVVDYQLANKMRNEIPGLINKLLEMSQDEITAVLSDHSRHRQHASMRALVETNAIAAWANECLIVDRLGSPKVGRLGSDESEYLYPNFAKFCEQTGRRGVVSLNTFTRSLQDVLATADIEITVKKKNTGAHIVGVRLRRSPFDDDIQHLLMSHK